ncbi:glycoside hydrolase family 26 protein [Mixia osmundae IAM 14324]|uniref:GH26 domain-containing protein n=1 Tax=Mixia osmundae (strain CBS 9802 / IAM 14324 / JCM 22182 / KY 12970) TaxID=764103 RepID=G7DX58_MIXOS|nr:glycoside hydrolase family 26 protein [Mixia osmundae IAM 14324]KEI37305.1 glycoside hydrolase family 26 protein [Mixia osmundae IAM 14324]GAA95168.1 hypothetical protein E5Q_01823 [Mixia osmundae IAM 14324]
MASASTSAQSRISKPRRHSRIDPTSQRQTRKGTRQAALEPSDITQSALPSECHLGLVCPCHLISDLEHEGTPDEPRGGQAKNVRRAVAASIVSGDDSQPIRHHSSRKASPLLSMTWLLLVGLCLALIKPVAAQSALYEPAGEGVLFGAWLNTSSGDVPTAFNARLGYNASVFQIAQQIPMLAYNYTTGAGGPAPEYHIEQSFTDAGVFLTVYPSTLASVTAQDLTDLGNQLLNYTVTYNRTCFLRWAPEMQGLWNPYGQQPTEYVALWKIMYPAIKAIAPNTAIVWAPNTGQSYPYGQTAPTNAADLAALDTNGDGQYDNADDPFSPYYPGDAYVDWIGMSVYYKGPNHQNLNVPQTGGFCSSEIHNLDPDTGVVNVVDFYETYCTKAGKACMLAESGSAYHETVAGGSSQLAMQQAWWQDCMLNTTFYDANPRLKLIMQFEYEKLETDGGTADLRDYRLTNATDVLAAFQQDLGTTADRFVWAGFRQPPAAIPTTGRPTDLPGQTQPATSTGPPALATVRNTQTSFPSLFFESSAGRSYALAYAAASASMMAVIGATAFMSKAL